MADPQNVIRGDDWIVDIPDLAWSDGTPLGEDELAAASYRTTVAGLAGTVTPDPVEGVRLRIEVSRTLTVDAVPSRKAYRSDVEITLNGKRSTKLFDVTVLADVTL